MTYSSIYVKGFIQFKTTKILNKIVFKLKKIITEKKNSQTFQIFLIKKVKI